jgi:penicillin-binding protein-related factor A (putative recombinase)
MAKKINHSKKHETAIREGCKSLPDVIIERLYDTMGGRMNLKQPSDFIAYKLPHIFYLEAKTVAGEQLQMSNISEHQWKSLIQRSKVNGCIAGIIVEYRLTEDENKVFFIDIDELNKAKNRQGKKYIDVEEAKQVGIEIISTK